MQKFYSHGKLLLTGEYAVLDGARALALPCKLGQLFTVKPAPGNKFQWISYLQNEQVWKDLRFDLEDILENRSNDAFASRLFQILKIIYQEKPVLFKTPFHFSTQLEFNKNWGLGSSSTLINNLAHWAQIDPYFLLEHTFGGSGYDIAAAQHNQPFIYQKIDNRVKTTTVEISDNLKPHIYFIYLNKKQDSREAIANYRQNLKSEKHAYIDKISHLTQSIISCTRLNNFETQLKEHENLISKITNQVPIQETTFKDYTLGIVKSLGAWGGDFILVTTRDQKNLNYFREKGYQIIYKYDDLIL